MKDRYIFRGKCVDTGNWHEGQLNYDKYHAYISQVPYLNEYGELCCDHYSDVNPRTIGQCTGLKDKNGKLIFEGDILHGREEGDGETTAWVDVHYIVFFDQHRGQWKIKEEGMDENSCWCDDLYEIIRYYEIIGNIHDKEAL